MAEERKSQIEGLSTEPPPPIDHDNSQLREPPVPDDHRAVDLPHQLPAPGAPQDDGSNMAVDNVLHSEVSIHSSPPASRRLTICDQIGVNTLLGRLKQSIASSRVRIPHPAPSC